MSSQLSARAPLVSVIIPALNEEGKIGRVLDAFPRDERFEAIVVNDGSSDGTGAEARAHGADLVIDHDAPGGVGAAIRDGWKAAMERGRPYVGLLAGDDQHDPADLVGALDTLLAEQADYVQGSRWMIPGLVSGGQHTRQRGTRIYSVLFSLAVGRRISDATNGFRIFSTEILRHPKVDINQDWLTRYDLEPYVLFKAIRLGFKVIEVPSRVRYHAEGFTKMRGFSDYWRLARPAVLLTLRVKS